MDQESWSDLAEWSCLRLSHEVPVKVLAVVTIYEDLIGTEESGSKITPVAVDMKVKFFPVWATHKMAFP